MIHENPMIFKDGLTLDKLPYIVWSTHNDLKMHAIQSNHALKEFCKALPHHFSKKFIDYFVHESYWINRRQKIQNNIILLLLSIPFIITLGYLLGGIFAFIGGITCGLIGNLIGNMLAQSHVIKQNLEKMRRGDQF